MLAGFLSSTRSGGEGEGEEVPRPVTKHALACDGTEPADLRSLGEAVESSPRRSRGWECDQGPAPAGRKKAPAAGSSGFSIAPLGLGCPGPDHHGSRRGLLCRRTAAAQAIRAAVTRNGGICKMRPSSSCCGIILHSNAQVGSYRSSGSKAPNENESCMRTCTHGGCITMLGRLMRHEQIHH